MASIPVELDTFTWPSKAAAIADFTAILRNSGYAPYDRIDDPRHEAMLFELLNRHRDAAEKTGVGADHFFIGRTIDGNPPFRVSKDATGIWIRRVDESSEDFSYLTAIRSDSMKSDAKVAMRELVERRRLAYRDDRLRGGRTPTSDLSGEPICSPDEAHVIYMNPTWAQLTNAFAISEGGWQNMPVHSGHGKTRIGVGFEDPEVERRWLDFHEQHAQLGLASASESNRRTRDPEAGWAPA